ncbi:Hypothetical predicted protein [Xyrichtys novacula]|uniref:Uncharacterized protein n=1 Tax=Xyrichtys novacula TaxID=13765 RepID=A0AAV1FK88_XYRNO|nr:Hypothetical predicted protein [Xyrichtys novacula]
MASEVIILFVFQGYGGVELIVSGLHTEQTGTHQRPAVCGCWEVRTADWLVCAMTSQLSEDILIGLMLNCLNGSWQNFSLCLSHFITVLQIHSSVNNGDLSDQYALGLPT